MLQQIADLYPLPFKFLDSYAREDKNIFFGREHETQQLYDKVSEHKITLIYGASGTGKTSLVNCGLANMMSDNEWLTLNVRRGNNMMDSLAAEIHNKDGAKNNQPMHTPAEFKKALFALSFEQFKSILVVFDQFEEIFVFGNEEERKLFAGIIREVVDSHVSIRLVFLIREEYLAAVTELEHNIPGLFDNRLRIERMSVDNALSAIKKPAKLYFIEMEDGVAEQMLQSISQSGKYIDLTYLQVYLDRLYQLALQEKQDDRIFFHSGLLQKAGDVSDLLASFLDKQIALFEDPASVWAALKSFVSVQGTKVPRSVSDISEYLQNCGRHLDNSTLQTILQSLVSKRILRENDNNLYELRHDALATKIHEKITLLEREVLEIRQLIENAQRLHQKSGYLLSANELDHIAPYESRMHLSGHLQSFIESSKRKIFAARRRKRSLVAFSLVLLLIMFTVFTAWALHEKNRAQNSEKFVKAGYFNNLASLKESTNPTQALRLAEHAYKLYPNTIIRNNMRRIYANNLFYRETDTGNQTSEEMHVFAKQPDGKVLFTGHDHGIIKSWDQNGNFLQQFIGHGQMSTITSIGISPDARQMVSSAFDGKVVLWNMRGEKAKILEEPVFLLSNGRINLNADRVFHQAAFSPDGDKIAAADPWNGYLRIYSPEGFKQHEINVPGLVAFDFVPPANGILTANTSGEIQFWSYEGRLTKSFPTGLEITGVGICPLSELLAVSHGNVLQLFDINGKSLRQLSGHLGRVNAFSFSQSGHYIITTADDQSTILWHISGLPVFSIQSDKTPFAAVFSETQNSITTASHNGFRVHETTGKLVHAAKIPQNNASYSHYLNFSNNGEKILYITGHTLLLYERNNGRINEISFDHKQTALFEDITLINRNMGCFTACGNYMFLSFGTHLAGLYDLNGNHIQSFQGHGKNRFITSIASSPDGSYLLTAASDSLTILWDKEGNILWQRRHDQIPSAIAFSSDSHFIATATEGGTICLWDISGQLIDTRETKYRQAVSAVGFSRDTSIIYAYSDQSFHFKEFADNSGIAYAISNYDRRETYFNKWSFCHDDMQIKPHKQEILPEGIMGGNDQLILAGSMGKQVKLTNYAGPLLQTMPYLTQPLRAAAISPDGQHIVVVDDNMLYIWERKKDYSIFYEEGNYEPLDMKLIETAAVF